MGVDPHEFGIPGRPPLGELLLSRGLITPEQLEQALSDQRESGRPLGDILIRHGFTNGPIIAQALATQHGGMLKSEYGFATGFDAVFSEPGDAPSAPRRASAAQATEQPARTPLKIVDAAGQSAPPAPEPKEERGPTADYISRLELQLAEAKTAIEASRLAHESVTSELHEALRQREETAERLAAELAERDAALASSVDAADESRHLVFFPSIDRGYVLLERPGPAPAVGDVVDTSDDGGSAFAQVTKVAQPPVPGPSLRCAYLL